MNERSIKRERVPSPVEVGVLVSSIAEWCVAGSLATAQVGSAGLLIIGEGLGSELCSLVRTVTERLVLRFAACAVVVGLALFKLNWVG